MLCCATLRDILYCAVLCLTVSDVLCRMCAGQAALGLEHSTTGPPGGAAGAGVEYLPLPRGPPAAVALAAQEQVRVYRGRRRSIFIFI